MHMNNGECRLTLFPGPPKAGVVRSNRAGRAKHQDLGRKARVLFFCGSQATSVADVVVPLKSPRAGSIWA